MLNILALTAFVYYPSIPIALIVIHKTMNLWRRMGKSSYYFLLLIFLLLDLGALSLVLKFKNNILSWKLYDHPASLVGLILIIFGFYIGIKSVSKLSFKVLIGVPEINPEVKTKLITNGIYKYIRHPRYLEFILELLGIAILTGLIPNFILFVYFVITIFIAAKIEENELIKRFDKEYLNYRKHTKFFIPKIL